MTSMIVAEGLARSFGSTTALDGVDLDVPAGSVLGLLGPNGAGKTTAVRILSTLLAADRGRAWVAGHDVAADPHSVRASIGLTGQYAAIDENLTGSENLGMIGWLLGLDRRAARGRARELLDGFGLSDAAGRTARTYSGGMRRRLDLAASLVGRPAVLFLDEPTTGLDPRSRLALWEVIRDLVADGTTALLTTQYLEEADALADSIVVIDRGRVVARGTADELKDRTGGASLVLRPSRVDDVGRALDALAGLGATRTGDDGAAVAVPVGDDTSVMAAAVRRVDDAGVRLSDLDLRRPSLDDVFLALTGHDTGPTGDPTAGPAAGRAPATV
ncbi:MAG: ATP-binding cassette domain-containing protein [Kineosporiaceae bacterium]